MKHAVKFVVSGRLVIVAREIASILICFHRNRVCRDGGDIARFNPHPLHHPIVGLLFHPATRNALCCLPCKPRISAHMSDNVIRHRVRSSGLNRVRAWSAGSITGGGQQPAADRIDVRNRSVRAKFVQFIDEWAKGALRSRYLIPPRRRHPGDILRHIGSNARPVELDRRKRWIIPFLFADVL